MTFFSLITALLQLQRLELIHCLYPVTLVLDVDCVLWKFTLRLSVKYNYYIVIVINIVTALETLRSLHAEQTGCCKSYTRLEVNPYRYTQWRRQEICPGEGAREFLNQTMHDVRY